MSPEPLRREPLCLETKLRPTRGVARAARVNRRHADSAVTGTDSDTFEARLITSLSVVQVDPEVPVTNKSRPSTTRLGDNLERSSAASVTGSVGAIESESSWHGAGGGRWCRDRRLRLRSAHRSKGTDGEEAGWADWIPLDSVSRGRSEGPPSRRADAASGCAPPASGRRGDRPDTWGAPPAHVPTHAVYSELLRCPRLTTESNSIILGDLIAVLEPPAPSAAKV